MTKEELWNWSRERGNSVLVFRVSDKFGDYGLVGLASFSGESHEPKEARIEDFILSCRVMGRSVEEAMLHVLSKRARQLGSTSVRADYIPTSKNQPCLAFFERSGMEDSGGRKAFVWDLREAYPQPSFIRVQIEGVTANR